jgi:hypothetical protein
MLYVLISETDFELCTSDKQILLDGDFGSDLGESTIAQLLRKRYVAVFSREYAGLVSIPLDHGVSTAEKLRRTPINRFF